MNHPLSLAPGFSRVSASRADGNRFNGFRASWHAMAILLGLWVGELPARSEIYETNGWKLDVSLRFDKPEFMLGEPTWFTLEVQNHSSVDLEIIVGGDYRNEVGRPDSFKIRFVGADGKPVPQPTVQMHMGGMTGPQKLPARGSYAFRLFVPHWATFSEPGAYSVTCARRLDIGKAGGWFKLDGNRIVSEPTVPMDVQVRGEVRVVAADPKKFGELIESLDRKIFENKWNAQEAAMQILTSLNDERVVPILNKAVVSGYTVRMTPAIWALGNFKSDEAFEGLKRAMAITAKDVWNVTSPKIAKETAEQMRGNAAASLARSPHPEAIPFLLKQRADESRMVRLSVVLTLAKRSSPEDTAMLMEFTKDKDEWVRDAAKREVERRLKPTVF